MIINTGCRTDIPAFFSEWFYNRIDEGFVYVRNPYYKEKITCYKLNLDLVDCIVFCTKNPKPMFSNLDKIAKFNQFWLILAKEFAKIGKEYNLTIKTCIEGDEFKKYGIAIDSCVTKEVIERAIHKDLKIPKI